MDCRIDNDSGDMDCGMDIESGHAMDVINFSTTNISTDETCDGRDRYECDIKNYIKNYRTGRTTWGSTRARVNKSPSRDVPSDRTTLATTNATTIGATEQTAVAAADGSADAKSLGTANAAALW